MTTTSEPSVEKAFARVRLLFANCATPLQIEFLIDFICNEPSTVPDREIQVASHAFTIGYNAAISKIRDDASQLPNI